jgi:hypothetical protein
MGSACLLVAGASAAAAGEDVPSRAVQRVAGGTEQRDLAAYQRKVEGIREGLAALDRIEGSYTAGDRSATYVAFVDGALPIVVAEQWELGAHGRGEAVLHFMHGDLLRYRSRTLGLANAGAPSDGWYERTMTLLRAGSVRRRYGRGERQAGRAGRARGPRRLAAGRGGQGAHRRGARCGRDAGRPEPRPLRLCRRRGVRGNLRPRRRARCGRVPGRESIVLSRVEAGSGFRYADGRQNLRGLGEEAFWGAAAPVPCTLAATSTALRLAPGSYPRFDPGAKPADDWSRLLLDLLPAIDACLRQPVGHLGIR